MALEGLDILKQLQSEGRLDSRGQFTMDLAARQEKLVVLQRKEPWLFLFKLAQAAVMAGARQLSIQADELGVAVEFDGIRGFAEEARNRW